MGPDNKSVETCDEENSHPNRVQPIFQQESNNTAQPQYPYGGKRSRPTNNRYEENSTPIENYPLQLPSRDREMPSVAMSRKPHRSQVEINSIQRPNQKHGRNAPGNSRGNTNSSSEKKPDRLIVGLIIAMGGALSVALGLLQYQHGQELNSTGDQGQGRKPRIFDDYFVGSFDGTNILGSKQSLGPEEYAYSPSGKFRVGLAMDGDLVLQEGTHDTASTMRDETGILDETTATSGPLNSTDTDSNANPIASEVGNIFVATTTIWSAGIQGAAECYMQDDGNLVIRTASGDTLWSSGTHKHNDATLIVDDGGRIGIRYMESLIWMQGVPQGTYRGPSSEDLTFPVRGTFYYAWYPQTWKVSSGDVARFEPDLGYYVSGNPAVVDAHIDQLEYGKFDLGIISWFGPSSNLDIARITNLMDRSLEMNANIKWTLYYEDEWKLDPDRIQLKKDLEYIKKWFAWHPTYAHVDGKPLIFIWNEDDCEVIDRWVDASDDEWFVIPKLFSNYLDCPVQPNNWHQYGPASEYTRFPGHSVSISPGFWHAGEARPRLPRLSESRWCDNVRRMVESGEPWQLITTFNEAGEGTGIESTAAHWPSESGYGYYLDCLHLIP